MNVIINEDFKAIFKGNVTPIDHKGEFAFVKDSNYPLATCKEVGKKNDIKIPSSLKTKAKINEFLYSELLKLDIGESKMSKTEEVIEIVNAGVEAGKADDEMLIEIIQSGVKFKEANTLFIKAMEEAGHRISPKERTAQIVAILEDAGFAPETYDEVKAMIALIIEGDEDDEPVADTSDKQALAAIRKWAKDNEVDLPKAPKKVAGRASGGSIVAQTLEFLLANKEATNQEVTDFVYTAKEGINEPQAKKYISTALQALEFAKKYAAE